MNRNYITPLSPEWYSARSGKFTASGFGNLMTAAKGEGFSNAAMQYIYEKAREKISGGNVKSLITKPMKWGTRMEAPALTVLERYLGMKIQECGLLIHPRVPEAGATPDALVLDDSGNEYALVEVKCPYNQKVHLKYYNTIKSGETLKRIVPGYYWQIQGSLWVFDLERCYFVSFDPRRLDEKRLLIAEIKRDEKDIARLEKMVLTAIETRDERIKAIRKG
ncbi:MAG: YqaJ viral recombinase family protein [Saprospiraceae bacterium]|nr:YqaJ viral recombinase family protein [Saprospiraceae bacterium]MCB9325442.1 YqaJ viral recombinase family protein [Lewinellaceae bacterium]